MKLFTLLASFAVAAAGLPKLHTNFTFQSVVSITPTNEQELRTLHELHITRGGVELDGQFDFWRLPRSVGRSVEVRVDAIQRAELVAIFSHERVTTIISDVTDLLERVPVGRRKPDDYQFAQNEYHETYHDIEEVYSFVNQLATDYAGLVNISKFGESYEGRDLLVACVSTDGCSGSKPAFFMNGGIHAREWLSHATVLYMFENLLIEHVQKKSDLLDRMDFYIVPHINPDGYSYTRSATANRMWRKTRKPTNLAACVGTDANRNFQFEWGGVGASIVPCSDTYRGGEALDQSEVQALQAEVLSHPQIAVYFDTHTYGNYFLSPWGYTEALPYPDADDHLAAGKLATDAISAVNDGKYGGSWTFGPSGGTLYPTSGSAPDTMYSQGLGSAKYSYTCELPGQVGSVPYGFIMPEEHILPIGRETFEGYKTMAEYALAHP